MADVLTDLQTQVAALVPKPPEDPTLPYKKQAAALAADAAGEVLLGMIAGGSFRELRPTPSWEELQAEDQAKQEQAHEKQELEDSRKSEADARAESAKLKKELAATQARMRALEAAENKKRIDAEMDRIRDDRARRGKRELDEPELRGRAARNLSTQRTK
jgi:hypothetical protein